ncbi:hypothetical protein QCE92_13905, partial [Staphylococcus aureus]|nr:hypothetical protein [Staphylococcus aureus]
MNEMTKVGATSAATAARAQTEQWLAAFNAALADGDPDAAAALFANTSFWRDLVAFTWNLTTVEDPDGVRDMLAATLPTLGSVIFEIAEEPTEADGVTEA